MNKLFKTFPSLIINRIQLCALNNHIEEPKPRIGVYPFISGDAFLAISDIAIIREINEPIRFTNGDMNNIIFCETGLICDHLSLLSNARVVIIHNGDSQLSETEKTALKKTGSYVFATNNYYQKGFMEPIPIGIENAYHRKNGSIHYYNPLKIAKLSFVKTNELLVSFSVNTNPMERNRVSAICQYYGYQNEKLSISEYRKLLENSKFVISPPGNGIDCHRTWEAIYHRAVPVIENKNNLFSHLELPIFSINSYEEFFQLSVKERDKIYVDFFYSGKIYKPIYMDYWINKILKTSQN